MGDLEEAFGASVSNLGRLLALLSLSLPRKNHRNENSTYFSSKDLTLGTYY